MRKPTWQSLRDSADWARKAADHEGAVELYTQALAMENVPWSAYAEMNLSLAYCHKMLGHSKLADECLTGLAEAAGKHGDDATIVTAYAELVPILRQSGDLQRGLQLAQTAMEAAIRSGQPGLRADALLSQGMMQVELGAYKACKVCLDEAKSLIQPNDKLRLCNAFFVSGLFLSATGEYDELLQNAKDGVELARSIGDRDWEGIALNGLAISTTDQTLKRSSWEEALEAFKDAGDLPYQSVVLMNSGTSWYEVGLYKRAIELSQRALEISLACNQSSMVIYEYQFLGINYSLQGDFNVAVDYFKKGITTAHEARSVLMEYILDTFLAMVYVFSGRAGKAEEALTAAEQVPFQASPSFKSNFLAYKAAVNVLTGDYTSARKYARQTEKILNEIIDQGVTDVYPSELAWWCYRAHIPVKKLGRSEKKITKQAWQALQLGWKSLLIPLENFSDAGLRRGFLHRDVFRRLLILEWLKYAPDYAVSEGDMAIFTTKVQKPGRFNEVFKRLLKVGVHLNSQRDLSRLPQEILDEVDELTGAERIALVLLDDEGNYREIKTVLPPPAFPSIAGQVPPAPDPVAFITEIDPQLKEVIHIRQGYVRQINPEADLTTQCSILTTPLLSQGRLVGVIYCDLRGCFGRFDSEDLNLLGVLANQAAVALENAKWSTTLEQRVANRTEELKQSNDHLEQRNSELTIINEIQQGLAFKLDFKGILELVGNRIDKIFSSISTTINLYDRESNMLYTAYSLSEGIRDEEWSGPLGPGLTSRVIQTGQPILLHSFEEATALGAVTVQVGNLADERPIESGIFVPLLTGDQVRGVIIVRRAEKNAFSEADERLLSTLASSMSVSLENAHLFEETQRLVKAEQERVAELEIINSIQQGLAAELDFQAIVDLVGDKLREVFKTGDLGITWWDEQANLVHYLYIYEHGKRLNPPASHPASGGIYEHLMANRQPYVMKTVDIDNINLMPGTDRSLSAVYIPIISSDRFLGDISIEDFEHENAFGEGELRLLTTIAASLGTALENARLFNETQRLVKAEQERVAELQIINSIQQGLAAELDFQAIVDLVGDKLREIFRTPDLGIYWYNEKADLSHPMYLYEHGQRLFMPPYQPDRDGPYWKMARTHQPLVWNTAVEGDAIILSTAGTDSSKSGVMIPIISSDRVLGSIHLENYEREQAFGEAEIRLLTTIAASLGSALENARLFDETQRLVKAEQERVQELQIINSIQQGLAAELDFQAIVDLVGDKLSEVLHSGNVGIRWYDENTHLVHYLYETEHGERLNISPTMPIAGGQWELMIKNRQPQVINTIAEITAMGTQIVPGTDQCLSLVDIPIISGDRFIGVIHDENFEREYAYGESELRLLTTIAASLGTALENARLFNETQRLLKETEQRNAELAIINSVQAALAAELNIQGIYDAVGDKIREIFHSDNLEIRIYDPQTNQIAVPYIYEKNQRLRVKSQPLSDKGFAAHVLRTRETLVINENMEKEVEKFGSFIFPGTQLDKSAVMVPLIVGDQARGMVNLSDFEHENAFSESDVRLLQTLVNSMSVALENARLFDETQRLLKETEQRNSELAIINSVQAALAAELNIQGIYDAVGDKIREIFSSDNLEIRIFDPNSNLEYVPYLYEKGVRIDQAPLERIDTGFSAHVARTRETLVINQNMIEEEKKYGSTLVPGTARSMSAVYVPLIVGDQVRGLVGLSDFERENAFSDSSVRLLQTLVNSMSVALENARLFNETQRLLEETSQRANELSIINSVSHAMSSQLQVDAIIRTVGDQVRDTLHSEVVNIYLYEAHNKMIHIPYSYDRKYVSSDSFLYGSGLTSKIIDSKQPLILGSFEEIVGDGALLSPNSPGDELMPQSYLGVPIVVGDKAIGAIDVQSYTRFVYNESHVRLLSTLASSMGVALENARLFAETQRLLRETEQRNAELAIINKTQEALASKLDLQVMIDLFGDEIMHSFPPEPGKEHNYSVFIALYDEQTNLIQFPYLIDGEGSRFTEPPAELGPGLTSEVIRTGKSLVLKTLDEQVTHGAVAFTDDRVDMGSQSWLGVPIWSSDRVIGVLSLQDQRPGLFTSSDVRLLSTMAASLGVALENARLFEETRRLLAETEQRNRELAIISRIGNALAGQLDPQGIYELVGAELQQVFDAQMVGIITYDRQENLAFWRYSVEKGVRQNVPPHIPGGFSGHILRTREPLLITQDVARRAREFGSTVLAGELPKCYLGVPLIAGGEVTGVITLQNIDRECAFNENDLRLLSTLALSMGVALENARLYQETQHHAVEMAALAEIGSDIASTHEMEPVLERMATKTRELMQVRDIALYLLQPDGHTLKPIVSQGKYAVETRAHSVTLGKGMTGNVALSGVAEIINEPEHDSRGIHIEGTALEDEEPECVMIAPLISRSKVIGVMSVYRDRDQGYFTQLELDFLVSLARQAAIAIESARLYAETERRATEMAALAEVSREISATLELQTVLERIASQARDLLAAGNSAVYLLQPDGKTLKAIAAEGDIAKEVMADDVQLGDGIIGCIVQSGVAEWVDDTALDNRAVTILGTEDILEGEKLLVAPLLTQERAIGALAVWREPDDPRFNQAELNFSISLAQQAVVAIENAKLFESAQESQRRMADIIDFLPDATFVVDREGRVIAWNHAIEEMTGVNASDILGKGNYEYSRPFYGERRPLLIDTVLLPDEEIERDYAHLHRSEGVLMDETVVTHLRGETVYLNATASALRTTRGDVVGAIETIRDVTDQKLAEKELHQAKVDAEAANQAKSAFLAMMSHEIRTPMNAIIGMSGLLMDTPLNPEQHEFAETIRSSGDSLLTIINDILDFSKIEAGKMSLEEVPFDLRECIEASLDLVKVKASEKALELAYQIDPGVPPAILGDVTRLRQVLINLLGNSVKFTEQGEIVLTVGMGEQPESLHFSVRDTGIGIPPDRISMLFKAFTQADASTSRRYGGTGLGLALSNRIVELMNGRMWVESEGIPGKGSTFHFIIFAKPAPNWKGHPRMEGEHPQLRGRCVLVVDDNATNRRILQLQTQAWGMLPIVCETPFEGLDVLKEGEKIDLAILDMQMPEMSGVELATEIRKAEANLGSSRRIPLVLSTSLGGREEAREATEFAAILLKPIRQSALFDMLMGLFASKAGDAAKPAAERLALDPEMAARHPLRILLAEDNVVNQKLALRLLSQMGYRADVAANGLEVLQAVKRQPYDVIFMDVQMPEMDGLEATRHLCAEIPTGKRPCIIAMTANAMQGDREMCLDAGMDDYLSKPIRVDELVNALSLAKPLPVE